jgi:glucan phosphorylase
MTSLTLWSFAVLTNLRPGTRPEPEEFLALGRVDLSNKEERYGLTPLAIRMCRSTNAVSRKHEEVSRALWQRLWPTRQLSEIPITHVTNGVHAPTWMAPLLRSLLRSTWERIGNDAPRSRAMGKRSGADS